MKFLVVDLASKMSAAMVRDVQTGEVLREFNSLNKSAFKFVAECRNCFDDFDLEAAIYEDVPYGISSQAMVKPVLRLQGVVILANNKNLDRVFWLNPSTWQKDYPGVGIGPRGMTKAQKDAARIEAARLAAQNLGYTAPDLVQEYIDGLPEGTKVLKKNTAHLTKAMTDHVDAFLMTDWLKNHPNFRDIAGVQATFI